MPRLVNVMLATVTPGTAAGSRDVGLHESSATSIRKKKYFFIIRRIGREWFAIRRENKSDQIRRDRMSLLRKNSKRSTRPSPKKTSPSSVDDRLSPEEQREGFRSRLKNDN